MGNPGGGTRPHEPVALPSRSRLDDPDSRELFDERGLVEVEELVVQGKLRPPPPPRHLVRRSRLLDALDRGLARPLTLISAPAGYGKTSLASDWVERCGLPTAWISLDGSDDDVASLVTHLVAAVRSVAPDGMSRTLRLLRAGILPRPGALELALINDLGDVRERFVLVLDGTERLRSRATQSLLVAALLRRPPAKLHLVLVGRASPVAAIAGLRAATGVSEIRAADLAFTIEETLSLLRNRGDAGATPGVARDWTAATEGWIAVMTLALDQIEAARLDDRPDRRALTSHVREYLTVEILERQPPLLRRFLTDLSVVDRMSEPLCEALADAVEARDGSSEGRRVTLAQLRRRGLPVVAIDDQNTWFRFHRLVHLFLADLRERRRDRARDAVLHRAASRWLVADGDVERAVGHALTAGDESLAAAVVEGCAERLMAEEEWERLRRLIRLIPGDTMCGRPAFHVVRAWRAFRVGRYTEAASAARMAESVGAWRHGNEPGDTLQRMGMLHAIRSSLERARGDPDRAIRQARAALAVLPKHRHFHRTMAVANLYSALWATGDRAGARALIDATFPTDGAVGGPRDRLLGLVCELHWAHGELASLDEATAICESMPESVRRVRPLAMARVYRGLAAYERNDLPSAQEDLEAALDSVAFLPAHHALDARQGLAKVCRAQGRHAAAEELMAALADGSAVVDIGPRQRWHRSALRAELALLLDSPAAALALVEPWEDTPAVAAWSRFHPSLLQARALLAVGGWGMTERVDLILERLERSDTESTADRFWIELHSLRALLASQRGNDEGALAEARAALALAEPLGFVRHFVDAGSPMASVLKPLAREEPRNGYVRRLLTAYYEDAMAVGDPARVGPATGTRSAPVDALTPKESAVLRLLSRGLYNKEIAERSFVSVETVKTHLKHIYRKLNVGSRRQAVTRAKALGLLRAD